MNIPTWDTKVVVELTSMTFVLGFEEDERMAFGEKSASRISSVPVGLSNFENSGLSEDVTNRASISEPQPSLLLQSTLRSRPSS